MKIAILTIATNNYRSLLCDLIESIDKSFLTDIEKDIFTFSDENVYHSKENNIIFNKIEHEPWPFITLNRFKFFNSKIEELAKYDYIIYMDCDLFVNTEIDTIPNTSLFGVSHPTNIFDNSFWTTEKNPKSTAYLPFKTDKPYLQGCLWGGKSSNVCDLIKTLEENINTDLQNDIIASWHDESHLNKYFSNISMDEMTILDARYAYPEKWSLGIEKKIIHKDKNMSEYPRFEGSVI
jgi:hypothetical protein